LEWAPSIDIFIRTYSRDFCWLKLSLLSIMKFVEGYRRIIIVMPGSSLERLRGDEIPTTMPAVVVRCDEYADDYIGQQISKLNADSFTDAQLIAHIDSDCVFCAPCSLPTMLTKNEFPIIRSLWRSRRPATDGWRCCIADFHGDALPFDVLTPPPLVYSRGLYDSLRRRCISRHRITLDDWSLSRTSDSMSEFGLLAAEAWFHHRNGYSWAAADDVADWPCNQYWSRSPEAARQRAHLAHVLGQQSK
jgi:hypothetical protein